MTEKRSEAYLAGYFFGREGRRTNRRFDAVGVELKAYAEGIVDGRRTARAAEEWRKAIEHERISPRRAERLSRQFGDGGKGVCPSGSASSLLRADDPFCGCPQSQYGLSNKTSGRGAHRRARGPPLRGRVRQRSVALGLSPRLAQGALSEQRRVVSL